MDRGQDVELRVHSWELEKEGKSSNVVAEPRFAKLTAKNTVDNEAVSQNLQSWRKLR